MLYSDGLSEQADGAGEMLGIAGLKEQFGTLAERGQCPPESIARQLGQFLAARQSNRPPEDDQSYLFARRV